jgi:hypothetical protein
VVTLSRSRHRVRGELQQRSSQREQQALDPQLPRGPRAEAFGVYLRELRHLPGPKIWRLRSAPEDQWFPRGREECDPRFWTILQESFYASYTHRGSQLSQHRMLQFTALRAAALERRSSLSLTTSRDWWTYDLDVTIRPRLG